MILEHDDSLDVLGTGHRNRIHQGLEVVGLSAIRWPDDLRHGVTFINHRVRI